MKTKKTREEVETLKADWKRNGILDWDIEDTEGFEEYRDELREYRLQCEAELELKEKLRKIEKCNELGISGNFQLLHWIETMEYRIKELERRLSNHLDPPGS